MIKSRAELQTDVAASPEYLLVAAALAQILYEGGIAFVDVDLPEVRGRIEASMNVQGTLELRVLVD